MIQLVNEKKRVTQQTNKASKERKAKQGKQAKSKYTRSKVERDLQKDNKNQVSERVLHLWGDGPYGVELANRSCSLAKGFTWSISKVGSKAAQTTVLQLQYQPWWNGRSSIPKNAKGYRKGSNAKTRTRSKYISTSKRLVPKIDRRVPTTVKLPPNWGKIKIDGKYVQF